MNKNILLTALCFALFVLSANAATQTASVSQNKVETQQCDCPCHKSDVKANKVRCKKHKPVAPAYKFSEEKMRKHMEAKFIKERAIIYNALALDEEQRKLAYDIDKATVSEIRPYLDKLSEERKALCKMKKDGVKGTQLNAQKKLVKQAKKDLKNFQKTKNAEFEKILTRLQRSKYHTIQKQKRQHQRTQRRKMQKRIKHDAKVYAKLHKYDCPQCGHSTLQSKDLKNKETKKNMEPEESNDLKNLEPKATPPQTPLPPLF